MLIYNKTPKVISNSVPTTTVQSRPKKLTSENIAYLKSLGFTLK